jgi:hypothetical protein
VADGSSARVTMVGADGHAAGHHMKIDDLYDGAGGTAEQVERAISEIEAREESTRRVLPQEQPQTAAALPPDPGAYRRTGCAGSIREHDLRYRA